MVNVIALPSVDELEIADLPMWWRKRIEADFVVGVAPAKCIDRFGCIQDEPFIREVVVANLATGEIFPMSEIECNTDSFQSPDAIDEAFFVQEAERLIQKYAPAKLAEAA